MSREEYCTRKWTSDAGASWWCPPKACMFCDHCTDIFWDYTNGPYMIICDIDIDPTDGGYDGTCRSFVEDGDGNDIQTAAD